MLRAERFHRTQIGGLSLPGLRLALDRRTQLIRIKLTRAVTIPRLQSDAEHRYHCAR